MSFRPEEISMDQTKLMATKYRTVLLCFEKEGKLLKQVRVRNLEEQDKERFMQFLENFTQSNTSVTNRLKLFLYSNNYRKLFRNKELVQASAILSPEPSVSQKIVQAKPSFSQKVVQSKPTLSQKIVESKEASQKLVEPKAKIVQTKATSNQKLVEPKAVSQEIIKSKPISNQNKQPEVSSSQTKSQPKAKITQRKQKSKGAESTRFLPVSQIIENCLYL